MAFEPQSKPSFTPRRKWGVGFDLTVRTLVVVAVLVMLNHLAALFVYRHNLSSKNREELTPLTKNAIRSVTNRVDVIIYYDRNDELYPKVAALLREYQALNPKIVVRTVDYLRDATEALSIKQKYQLPDTAKDEEKNFVIFECEGRPSINPGEALVEKVREIDWEKKTNSERFTGWRGETAFTAMLLAVTNPKPFVAYFLMGHGEHNIESGDEYTGYLDFKGLLQQNAVQVGPLFLTGTNPIPADCSLLVIAGPRSTIPESELEKISQYLDEGGRALVLVNAATVDRTRGLENVLSKWGVDASDDVVTDPQNSLRSIKIAPSEDVTVGIYAKHPAVAALSGSYLNLFKPRVIQPAKPKETANGDAPKTEWLFASAMTSSLSTRPSSQKKPYPLAVAVQKDAVRGVVTGRGNLRMIVVGDSFFFANEPLKTVANREFATYAVNWLLNRPQFTEGIAPKPYTDFRINITTKEMSQLSWLLLGAVPGGVLLFGVFVWWRRRK